MIEKYNVEVEVEYSKDKKNKFYMKKVWNKDKPLGLIIMNAPGNTDGIVLDLTTMLIVNNMSINYGGVIICNLFPEIGYKPSKDNSISVARIKKNDETILQFLESVSIVILAVGSISDTNKVVADRQEELLEKLTMHKDKLRVICDADGNGQYSPLYPKIRNNWNLKQLELGGDANGK